MKAFALLALIFAGAASVSAGPATLEELNSHLFTNAPIVWEAPTNNLPKAFWIYKRHLPQIFNQIVISNAIVLASLQSKGFPKPSTDEFYIPEDKGPNYEGPIPVIFEIRPADANLSYYMPNCITIPAKGIPSDEAITKRAWEYALKLELDPAKLVQQSFYTRLCSTIEDAQDATTNICGRGVFLSRQLDGISFFSADNEGNAAEGFSIAFGSHEEIRSFSMRWSNVERYENHATASQQQINDCIRAHKTIVLPRIGEEDFFARLRTLARAKKLTVTKITPYYGEGIFGEIPTNDTPCEFVTPFAELEAVADFGSSNAIVRLIAPILSSEASRLLGTKAR
ncbi:MAG TPA: hypothetical protein VN048_05930 [Verrucomicrobiae bacterium]|jgi:hypothetical protein|nr:hypothetical protein [Verrucomicrobiae bacterium]